MGFLGAIVFTALVLVLQSEDNFKKPVGPISGTDYLGLLISVLAITCVLSIVGSLALATSTSGHPSKNLSRFSVLLVGLAFSGVLFTLPMLILPFDWRVALMVGTFEVFMYVILLRHVRSS